MAGIEVPGSAVVEVLDARGGQAVVYRARQPSVADRHAAIKVYTRLLADDRGRRQFEREVAVVARLSGHRHVVQLYDAGVLADQTGRSRVSRWADRAVFAGRGYDPVPSAGGAGSAGGL